MDLASYTVVREAGDILPQMIAEDVNILIANEDEAAAYAGTDNENQALEYMVQNVDVAVLKRGARGSVIAQNGNRVDIAAAGDGAAVDTTGAGDLWAAGFLFGLVNGMPLDRCGALGSRLGYEVCQVVGADIPDENWEDITRGMEKR
jgi:sugar/nucleoside kinase (ribokinase family)